MPDEKQPSDKIVYLDPRDLHPMPNQPRQTMDMERVRGLAQTFEEKGFKGAVIIWYPAPGYAELISGHRSHAAFLLVAEKYSFASPWDKIPCAVFEGISKAKAFELAILYNEKREDLTLYELAVSWDRLIHEFAFPIAQVAKDFETSEATIYNTISILKEPDYIIQAINEGTLRLPDILGLRRIKDAIKRKQIAVKLISGEIPKAQLPHLAGQINRQTAVIAAIPELSNILNQPTTEEKPPIARMEIHIPKDFTLYFTFAAATRIDWMQLPQRNILVSGYHILHRTGKLPMVEDMINRREFMDSLMIDSAGIVAMGMGDTDWFNRQPELVEFANAVEATVVSMLDVLTKAHLLEKCKLTVARAQEITIRNAEQFLDLKTKARKCYVLQGNTDEEYERCIKAYQDLGVFSDDRAIIGVGSRAGERRETTIARYGYCCKRIREINPSLGIHAFGIGTPYTLVELYKLGVTQADNATPQVLTQINQWIDAHTGEPAKGVKLASERISAMWNAQLLWNYAAYYVGLSNAFQRPTVSGANPSC